MILVKSKIGVDEHELPEGLPTKVTEILEALNRGNASKGGVTVIPEGGEESLHLQGGDILG